MKDAFTEEIAAQEDVVLWLASALFHGEIGIM